MLKKEPIPNESPTLMLGSAHVSGTSLRSATETSFESED
jgi:hypothetical protein